MGDGAMRGDYMIEGLVIEPAIPELLKARKVWRETSNYYGGIG